MRLISIVILLVLVSCNASVKGKNGVVYKSAGEYNQYIMEKQKQVINVILNFGKAVKTDLDDADHILDDGIKTVDHALDDIKGMPPYHGDSTFRDAAVSSFEFYKEVIGGEYKKIVSIRRKGEYKTDEDINYLQQLPSTVGKREEKCDRNFHNAQKDFADKNHLRLIRNELQGKIDSADRRNND